MREKRKYRIFTFSSTTQAIAFEKNCERNQIPGRIIPVPREISASCGLSWRMTEEDYRLFGQRLKEYGLEFEAEREVML